jgi:LmbE family N-acetylglucosaminyl deacetylase
MTDPWRLLCVFAHPDDESMGTGGTLANAKRAAERAETYLICAADASFQDAENFAPHRVSKLYYMVDSENFINLVTPFVAEITFPVDHQLRGEGAWQDWMITTRIEMAEHCHAAWRAIQCHQSQLPSWGLLAEMHEEVGVAVLAMQGDVLSGVQPGQWWKRKGRRSI